MTQISKYKKTIVDRFWKYQQERFPDWREYFEQQMESDGRPPVFL